MTRWMVAGALALAALSASAQNTPVGLWKTIDDDGKTEKSLVRISDSGGVLSGKIEKIFDPAKQDSTCDKCTDERKDKPVLGMVILRNLKKDPDDQATWSGGEVLDPNNGKTYKARLKPLDGGKQLQMRGYLGPFYRTQVWLRVE
ncbi:MAG TPA: DUF2147 domain-containing protein [Burkholderiaceae bacterium]|nr:DUF2147 domain-containing protein [Burkholderiaceae bacterium]